MLAANPCPCGNADSRDQRCDCPPMKRVNYLKKLSGPLLDRVDIRLRVPRVTAAQLRTQSTMPYTSSADARQRVVAARSIAHHRWRETPWQRNSQVPGSVLRSERYRLPHAVSDPLDRALEKGLISMRGYDRTLRVAWTLADLDGQDSPGLTHVGGALRLRRGDA